MGTLGEESQKRGSTKAEDVSVLMGGDWDSAGVEGSSLEVVNNARTPGPGQFQTLYEFF